MILKNVALILTLFIGFMLTGCAFNQPNGDTELLNGTGWLLTELGGSPVASSPAMTLNFSDKVRVNGSDGCNQYRTTYTAENGTINISENMVSTEKACPGAIMQQAATFITALKQAVAYRTENAHLILLAADGSTAVILVRQ